MDGYDARCCVDKFLRERFSPNSLSFISIKTSGKRVEKEWNSLNFFELFDILVLLSSSMRPAHCYAHFHVKLLISGQRGGGGEGYVIA